MSRHSATGARVNGLRLLAGCLLLVGLAFVQDPGYLVSDTKFDLAVAPDQFLSRALHLWDAQGAFGQLQNQAYGYLWPMGPFFLGGWAMALPGWVVQRLWQGLVMSVAFAGFAKLARAVGVRSDVACLLGGFAFALSPRLLTTLGPISSEAWPSALAPWVLLPLVLGSRHGSPRRAAGLSALAVAMVGGINAVATFAVIPLGALWILTRTPGPRRRALMIWWPLFTLLGTLWWLVPLFVMGAYSPPFLDFIETTTVTTFPTTIFDSLRGTSDWVPYIDPGSRAGNDLITTAFIALDTGALLFLGFLGLADRRTPERLFLWSGLLVGLLLVTMGHHGSVEGWFQQDVRSALDGALAPLRNVHKFDPIVRIPLVLGLAFVVDRAVTAARSNAGDLGAALERFNRVALSVVAVVVVAGAATPAIAGRIEPADPTLEVPEYWSEAAAWLEAHSEEDDDGGSLLVPGAPFGEYLWGSPKDEPLQWLAGSPWAVRNVIPLTPPGNIRMLDEIEAALVEGRGSAGLTEYLRRAGVRFLVVRNDLASGSDVPSPLLVHQAIEASPGLERTATFGPEVGGGGAINVEGTRALVDHGWQASYPAVEVFAVPDDAAAVTATDLPVVVGGPEDLLDLGDLGVLDDQPTELAVDADPDVVPDSTVLTDGLRARERFFGRVHDGYSPALTPGDERRSGNPTRDYLLADDDRWSTTVRLSGASAISASSSESDSTAFGGAQRGRLPYAAVDRSPESAWRSGFAASEPAWWQLDLGRELEPGEVRLTGGPGNPDNLSVVVRTEAGVSDPVRLGEGSTRTVRPADGPTTWLRVEVVGDDRRQLALADVVVPGVRVDRSLVLPELPETWGDPDTIALRADLDARTGCVNVGRDVRCAPDRAQTSEEAAGMSRVVTLNEPASYDARMRVVPRAGPELQQLVLGDQPVNVDASSVLVPEDPRDGAFAAIDGDRGTAWLSDPDDQNPTLELNWIGQQTLRGIWLRVDRQAAGRRPTEVRLSWPGGTRVVELERGRATFRRPITTDLLSVTVTDTRSGYSVASDGQTSGLGVAISDVRFRGLPYLPVRLSLDEVRYSCGSGPDLRAGASTVPTRIVGSPFEIARGTTVDAVPCADAPVELDAGENTIAATTSATFTPASIVLGSDAASPPAPGGVAVDDDGPVRQEFAPAPGADLLVVRQNVNPGWEATQDGDRLTPVTVDGWQQGWRLESGDPADVVTAEFAPDRAYRIGLVVGALALLGLVAALALLLRGRERPEPAPLEARDASPLVLVPFAVVGVGLVAGWVGVVVAALTVPVVLLVDRRLPDVSAGLFALPCLAAAAAYALHPWGDEWAGNLAWPHYLMLVPLASALAVLPLRRPRRPGRIAFRRSAGRSTSR